MPGSINSHYFHIIGDGHQPNSRGLYTQGVYIPIIGIPIKGGRSPIPKKTRQFLTMAPYDIAMKNPDPKQNEPIIKVLTLPNFRKNLKKKNWGKKIPWELKIKKNKKNPESHVAWDWFVFFFIVPINGLLTFYVFSWIGKFIPVPSWSRCMLYLGKFTWDIFPYVSNIFFEDPRNATLEILQSLEAWFKNINICIYTWNLNDLYFWRSTLQNKAEIPINTRVIWVLGMYRKSKKPNQEWSFR